MADEVPPLAFIFTFSPEELKRNQKTIADEYTRLLKACRDAGLAVVGKRSKTPGTIAIFVDCHDDSRRDAIVSWENPTIASRASLASAALEPSIAVVVRALYTYTSLPRNRGGLGLSPGSKEYPHLKLVLSPHSPQFRKGWIKKLAGSLNWGYPDADIAQMGVLYGEPTAIYFAFLTHYMRSLILPAVIGVGLHFQSPAFIQHPLFSVFLVVWAIVFAEQWRQKYRRLSPSLFEKSSSPSDTPSHAQRRSTWWLVEAKTALAVPLLLVAGGSFVCFNMTVAFLLEAFIMRLYDGPLSVVAPLIPTVYNVITTPPFVAVYSAISDKITSWEGHTTQRAHDFSLLVKLLPINGIVAFYALILSAVIYIPYGDELMSFLHLTLFQQPSPPHAADAGSAPRPSLVSGTWRRSVNRLPPTTPKTRLAEQMFSFTLVLQLFPIILEILMPFVVRFAATHLMKRGSTGARHIVQGDKKGGSASTEDELVDTVVFESSLPPHRFFDDYLTLVIQFGYGVMWSTTWPLTPAVLLLLAIIRLRTDALKMLVHYRRPVPSRDAAGIWTGALSSMAWAGALINTLLVLVVHPTVQDLPSAHDDVTGGPRPHKIDIPALVQRTQNSTPSSLASVAAIRLHLQSTILPDTPALTIAAGGVILATFLASCSYSAAQWYIHHLFASAQRDQVLQDEARVILPDTLAASARVAPAPAAVHPSPTFWVEDEGGSEIWKKVD